WKEVLAGQKAFDQTGNWLPDETIDVFKEYLVGIKGPLTTPIGGGIRSLNVALRKALDLYVCQRPTRWYTGVPSPVKHPENVDIVVFRENTEDIYAGVEFAAGSTEAQRLQHFLKNDLHVDYNFTRTTGVGLKFVSEEGSKRLVRAAIEHALGEKRKSVTLVHKGIFRSLTMGPLKPGGIKLPKKNMAISSIHGINGKRRNKKKDNRQPMPNRRLQRKLES